jgi:NADH-quinone oxidoreductase subunit L
LSLAGVPLFAGFASKEEVLGSVWAGGFHVPFFMLLFAAFLTAFYMFRVVCLAFFGRRQPEAGRGEPAAHAQDSHDTAHHGHGAG